MSQCPKLLMPRQSSIKESESSLITQTAMLMLWQTLKRKVEFYGGRHFASQKLGVRLDGD